jgi:hypothetical protein
MTDLPEQPSPPSPGGETSDVIAEVVAFLDCKQAHLQRHPEVRLMLLTIGRADGTVEQLAFDKQDAERFFALFSSVLERPFSKTPGAVDTAEVSPATRRRGSRRAVTPRVLKRIESRLDEQGIERRFEHLTKVQPHLAEYIVSNAKSAAGDVSPKTGEGVTKSIQERLLRVLLVMAEVPR